MPWKEWVSLLAIKAFVVGGQPTSESQYPFFLDIRTRGTQWAHCGAALIAPQWAVTAAHCVASSPYSGLFDVELCRFEPLDSASRCWVPQRILVHPQFGKDSQRSNHFDIALIHWNEPLSLKAIKLPGWDVHKAKGSFKGLVIGRGVVHRDQIWQDHREWRPLHVGVVRIFTPTQCQWMWQKDSLVEGWGQEDWKHFICAGWSDGRVDACFGDSGSPLMMKTSKGWVLIGLVSWGRGCGKPYRPTFYTHIWKHLGWIKSVLKSSSSQSQLSF